MEKEKMFYVRFKEEEYMSIPSHIRVNAIVIDDDFNQYKSDPLFIALYGKYKKAKKELETYKFNKRHG